VREQAFVCTCVCLYDCVCVCVCVPVCGSVRVARVKKREREKASVCVCAYIIIHVGMSCIHQMWAHMFVCVFIRMRLRSTVFIAMYASVYCTGMYASLSFSFTVALQINFCVCLSVN